jgi:hypothetical protein
LIFICSILKKTLSGFRFGYQVHDAIWVAQKAHAAIRSEWEEATPLMQELDFKPKLLMFKTWLWAFATV